jgi:hypothetical protein
MKSTEISLNRIKQVKLNNNEERAYDRFTEFKNSKKILYAEEYCEMTLGQTHAVLDWKNEEKSDNSILVSQNVTVEMFIDILRDTKLKFEFDEAFPTKIKKRIISYLTSCQKNHELKIIDKLWVFCEIVWLYTLEQPAIYRTINSFLGNTAMWEEKNSPNRYVGYTNSENTGINQKDYEIFINYSTALIQSLYILHKTGIINSVRSDNTNLFRGLDLDFKEVESQQDIRNRWTTFVSLTKNKGVAKLFGNIHSIKVKAGSKYSFFFFDISNLSEFPKEEEVLLLPGITGGILYANDHIHYRRFRKCNQIINEINTEEFEIIDLDKTESLEPEEKDNSSKCTLI